MQFKFSSTNIREIGKRLLKIRATLESNILSTLWVSDLHGDGERFIKVLQSRFGMLYTTCQEALGTDNDALIKNITRLIRRKSWSPNFMISKRESLAILLKVLRYKVQTSENQKLIDENHSLAALLLQSTFSSQEILEIFSDHKELFDYAVQELSSSIISTIPDRIVVLGDIFDRGPTPDKIIRVLKLPYYKKKLSMIWGNHDILWLGACVGNRTLVAEVVRITCRYDHLVLLERLGLDSTKLKDFALEFYPASKLPSAFKAQDPACKSMEKALAIIQFKLQEKIIFDHPEYKMDDRLQLKNLSQLLQSSKTDGLTDTHFPTLDHDDPWALHPREQEVIDHLTDFFVNSLKLKKLMSLLVEKARIFDTYQDFLNIHALVPSNSKGDYEEFLGYKGKELLEYIQKVVDRAGKRYINGQSQKKDDGDLIFYLWCGPKSPLFGKDAMKTFERYFFKDKETHREKTLFWEKNISNKEFQEKIKKDFGVKHIVFGHTPKNIKKGDKMLLGDAFAINIDGGFSKAYLKRGHALVRTAYNLYGIVLPEVAEAKQALADNQVLPLIIEIIEKHENPLKNKDLVESKKLLAEEKELLFEIKQLSKVQAETSFQSDEL